MMASGFSTPYRTRAWLPMPSAIIGSMYYGSRASWNLRDSHMFETLKNLLNFHGGRSKAIVWAHNSHVGDSAATEMSARDEFNIGHLCRRDFGDASYSIGFGTDSGTVAAASNWDEPMQIKSVRPALAGSYERLCHESGSPRFLLPLRGVWPTTAASGLLQPRLERAIGVIYRPETELQSHYFEACCRASSTSTSGSTRPVRSVRCALRSSRACPTPTRSVFEFIANRI